jgi:hypothetical protein
MKYIKPEFDLDFSHNIPVNINALVDQYLTNCPNLSDYIDETDLISDQVLVILFDAEDDKLGRIKDLYNKRISEFADFVESAYDYNDHAAWVFELAKDY